MSTHSSAEPKFHHMPPEIQEQLRRQEEHIAAVSAQKHQDNLRSEQARTRANRANACFSTGPRTLSGKEVSRMNAVRHGLTGRQVLLPSEDAEAYTAHIERFRRDLAPVTERELELTQMLADTQWRLNRIPGLESAIFAMGRLRYVDLYLDVDAALRSQLIDCYTMEQSAKQINNLSIQEGRLRRQYTSDLKELKALQSHRQQSEEAAKPSAQSATATATQQGDWVRFYNLTETNVGRPSGCGGLQSDPNNSSTAPSADRLQPK